MAVPICNISRGLINGYRKLLCNPQLQAPGLTTFRYSSNEASDGSSLPGINAPIYIQGFQGREHEFSKYKVRNLDRSGEESEVCTSGNGNYPDSKEIADQHDCYQPMSNVSLYSVMQTNVPDPYNSTPGHMNMPGGGIKLGDKFTSSSLHDTHPSNRSGTKYFSTMSSLHSKQASQEQSSYSYGVNPEDVQGVQGPFTWLQNHTVDSLSKTENPCPQGIQGLDCEKFKLWIGNCTKYNFVNCEEQLQDLRDGRKTLGQIFEEQEKQIEDTVLKYQGKGDQVGKNSSLNSNEKADVRISQKDKLKNAVKQYGATVIVFHVGISLMSLGGFYVAVSSGLDVVAMLERIGVGQSILQSRLATGASTFVVAYAVHKVFAPVRIGITLTCTPLIVRYLRKLGMLKAPKKLH